MPDRIISGHWYREHADRADATDRGCWWFTSAADGGAEPDGRFDLKEPRGTCYVGVSPGVAVRERCGRFLGIGIPIGHLTGRVVSKVDLPATVVADVTNTDGARLGVIAELATGHDYQLTAQWAQAQALDESDFEGILYAPRFTPAGGPEHAVALFGATGAASGIHPVLTSRALTEVVVELGYQIVGLPTLEQLVISDDDIPSAEFSDG